eukprot:6918015-Prymnesium_polylepis.1
MRHCSLAASVMSAMHATRMKSESVLGGRRPCRGVELKCCATPLCMNGSFNIRTRQGGSGR